MTSAFTSIPLNDEEELVAIAAGRLPGKDRGYSPAPSVQRRAAFDALLNRHSTALRTYLKNRLPTREDAEDVYQQTCLSAWQHIDQCDALRFRAWMLAIAANKVRDVYRERASAPKTTTMTLAGEDSGCCASTHATSVLTTDVASEILEHQSFLAAVGMMVQLLSEEYAGMGARIAWRRWVDGWSSRQIAEELGLKPNAVDQRLHQMRNRLRRSEELRGLLLDTPLPQEGSIR